MSIYTEVLAKGGYISNHESDLYIEDTPENWEIIQHNIEPNQCTVTRFRNEVTGKTCLDVPFAYDPFWERAEHQSWLRRLAAKDA